MKYFLLLFILGSALRTALAGLPSETSPTLANYCIEALASQDAESALQLLQARGRKVAAFTKLDLNPDPFDGLGSESNSKRAQVRSYESALELSGKNIVEKSDTYERLATRFAACDQDAEAFVFTINQDHSGAEPLYLKVHLSTREFLLVRHGKILAYTRLFTDLPVGLYPSFLTFVVAVTEPYLPVTLTGPQKVFPKLEVGATLVPKGFKNRAYRMEHFLKHVVESPSDESATRPFADRAWAMYIRWRRDPNLKEFHEFPELRHQFFADCSMDHEAGTLTPTRFEGLLEKHAEKYENEAHDFLYNADQGKLTVTRITKIRSARGTEFYGEAYLTFNPYSRLVAMSDFDGHVITFFRLSPERHIQQFYLRNQLGLNKVFEFNHPLELFLLMLTHKNF